MTGLPVTPDEQLAALRAALRAARPTAHRVMVTQTALGHLDGSSLFIYPDALDEHGYGQAGQRLVYKLLAARRRWSGRAVPVDLDKDEAEVLREIVDVWECAAVDDASHDPSARGELIAARSLLRKLDGLEW